MKIEPLENYPAFIPTIAKWLYDQWGWKHSDGSVARAEHSLATPPGESGLPIAFAAVEDDKPVGVARLTVHDMETRKEFSPWLASVLVPKEHRKKGIGTALCSRVITEAGKMGYPILYLFTPDREPFYTRQGWEAIEHTNYRDEDVVIMQIKPDKIE